MPWCLPSINSYCPIMDKAQQLLIRNQLQQFIFKSAAQTSTNPYSKQVFRQLANCHTANLGMHRLHCNDSTCGHERYQYHNCNNRHCPNCGGARRDQWIEDKTGELLPTAYYHVVFTVPHELNRLTLGNRKAMFDLLFEAGNYTLQTLAKDPTWLGATPGIISILHTWGQELSFHPHIHCIVSGGGLKHERWVQEKRKNHNYLFPKKAMQLVYRAYYLKRLQGMIKQGLLQVDERDDLDAICNALRFKHWNVYAKRPFGGPKQVLEYLGRYTHKVAITTHRILAIDKQARTITFAYKNYHCHGTTEEHKTMTLSIDEFTRRFEQHILPFRFTKIRHYGYLKNYRRTERLAKIFADLRLPKPPPKVRMPIKQRMLEKTGVDITRCPVCNKGTMELEATYYRGVLSTKEPKETVVYSPPP